MVVGERAGSAGLSGLAALAFALIGTGVSVYLTIDHYDAPVTLACPESSTIKCAKSPRTGGHMSDRSPSRSPLAGELATDIRPTLRG